MDDNTAAVIIGLALFALFAFVIWIAYKAGN
jgi:hypothetical protein